MSSITSSATAAPEQRRRGRPPLNRNREISGGVDGNTNTPPESKKDSNKQPNQLKFWSFTYNNFIESDIETLANYFKANCVWYVFQHEVGGNSHHNHLQGTIQLRQPARWTEFGLPKAIHWEKTENIEAAKIYCMKLDAIGGRISNERIWHSPDIYPPQEEPIKWVEWNSKLRDIIAGPQDNRVVHWYWSEEGRLGKTTFVRHCMKKYGGQFATGGKYTDIMNLVYHTDMDKTPVVFFTLPREHKAHISYSALESIKDGLVSNMKSFKNGSKMFSRIPHVVVFANYPPDTAKLSKDRWNVVQILPTLIDQIEQFDKDTLTHVQQNR